MVSYVWFLPLTMVFSVFLRVAVRSLLHPFLKLNDFLWYQWATFPLPL